MRNRTALKTRWWLSATAALIAIFVFGALQHMVTSQATGPGEDVQLKGLAMTLGEALSAGGRAALFGPHDAPSENPEPGYHDNGPRGTTFRDAPPLDPLGTP